MSPGGCCSSPPPLVSSVPRDMFCIPNTQRGAALPVPVALFPQELWSCQVPAHRLEQPPHPPLQGPAAPWASSGALCSRTEPVSHYTQCPPGAMGVQGHEAPRTSSLDSFPLRKAGEKRCFSFSSSLPFQIQGFNILSRPEQQPWNNARSLVQHQGIPSVWLSNTPVPAGQRPP